MLPELPALRMEIDEHHQHKDVYAHSLTVLEQAIALERRPDRVPDLVLRLAALLHDIGKPATRRHEPGGGVSFHHHEVVGAKLVRAAAAGAALPEGRRRGRRPADLPAPALPRLRRRASGPTPRSAATSPTPGRCWTGCTSWSARTARPATSGGRRRWRDSYDALEERIARIAAEEDLRAVRPDLDGNEIMALLGLPPGPLVGAAWRFLKELRLDRGPLAHDEAVAELLRWARDRGLETPAP